MLLKEIPHRVRFLSVRRCARFCPCIHRSQVDGWNESGAICAGAFMNSPLTSMTGKHTWLGFTTMSPIACLSAVYLQTHLLRLCDVEIHTARLSVEGLVSLLVLLMDYRLQERRSNRRTDELHRQMASCKVKIRASLTSIVSWHESAGYPEPVLSEMDVFNNVLPWQTSGIDIGKGQLQLKLYKMESELERCEEELDMLPGDAVKVLLYYGFQIRLLQEWLVTEHPHPAQASASGKVQLMFEKLQKIERQHAEALKVFKGCGLLL